MFVINMLSMFNSQFSKCALGLISISLAQPVQADQVYEQIPEISASTTLEKLDSGDKAPVKEIDFAAGIQPEWIWGPKDKQNYSLEYSLTLNQDPKQALAARVMASCDNEMELKINGQMVFSSTEWQSPENKDVKNFLQKGENKIQARVKNHGGVAAFLFKLVLIDSKGETQEIVSNGLWNVFSADGTSLSDKPTIKGKLGDGPWGNIFSQAQDDSFVPRDTFLLKPGYQVEKLFTVPKAELGSWVSIAFDPQGRMLASDQGDKGICRITPAPPGSDEPTRVERLNLPISSAQGMLCAFDALYLSINGGPGSGLYRARDTTGDDQYDELTKLKDFRGGGEHGPHALRLSPDGKSIFVICGNHTDPPFSVEQISEEEYSSRVPINWSEDLLLPRQWDANGHARGKLAPGGWIAKTDPEGNTWEIYSSGYRNPYDMDFNTDGELFAYDADMEWDLGSPWYRPTRVSHATSGSEFGWRSGTGKWPAYYPDSLPALVNIGPGSPVGVCFGTGTNFPERDQNALFICDWTFGTMYAIHIQPHGASYTATKEEFLSRTPLPLTDNAVGPDGAMYFTVGGRGTQSELYRVRYIGKEKEHRGIAKESQADQKLKSIRHHLETFHASESEMSESEIMNAVNYLQHEDRFLRYAARIALEHQPVEKWSQAVLDGDLKSTGIINGVVGLARQGDAGIQTQLIEALDSLHFGELSTTDQLELLRAWQLVFTRLGPPSEEWEQKLAAKYDPYFPVNRIQNSNDDRLNDPWDISADDALNRELATLLVYWNSPNIAAKIVKELQSESSTLSDQDQLNQLIARNKGYGRAVESMLERQPDLQQIHYAFVLRNLKQGWTLEERKNYFSWFEKASKWSGGNSFQKFLQNIETEAFENASEKERLAIEASGARKPYQVPELPKPVGPGKDRSTSDILELAETGLKSKRDYENGKKMFAATRCIVCHRFDGDGGATGPDLTQLAGRFNLKDLTEAIVEPSKVISDQYRAMQVVTIDGKVYTGRVLSESQDQFTLLLDPEDATKFIDIARDDVDAMVAAKTSLMPNDLLKSLNDEEVLDLLAYLLSRGNPNDPIFRGR